MWRCCARALSAAQRRACAAGDCTHGIRTFHSAVGSGRPAGQYGGVVLLGCRLFFMPLIHQWAQQAGYAGAGAYLMVGMVGCPCTLVITGGLGRFVAPLCRREAVYDEDLLLRGLWKLCTANCPSADKP